MTAAAPTRRGRWLAVGAVVLVALLGIGTALAWYFGLIFTNPSARGEPVAVPPDAVETVATGLDVPWALSRAWKASDLVVLDEAGHGGGGQMSAALVAATDRFGRS